MDIVGPDHISFMEAESIEFKVFSSLGYTESKNGSCNEYLPWRDDSRFAVVEDETHRIRGLVRMIHGSFSELPAAALPNEFQHRRQQCLEYASLAVLPGDRGAGISETLYRAVWIEATRLGVEWLVAIVDPWLHVLLAEHYGFPFEPIGPQTEYMGGDVLPIAASMAQVTSELQRWRPNTWRWFDDGLIEAGLRAEPASGAHGSDGVIDLRSRDQSPENRR